MCLIFWFLWCERNSSLHDRGTLKPLNVIWRITMNLRGLVTNGAIKPSQWKECSPLPLLSDLYPRRARDQRPIPLKWTTPNPPWLKVNISDVSSALEGRAAGGVVRDHLVNLITAFGIPYNNSSRTGAKALRILHGIHLTKELGNQVWVESDAHQVISPFINRSLGLAEICHTMASLLLILRDTILKFTSIPRGGYKATTLMA